MFEVVKIIVMLSAGQRISISIIKKDSETLTFVPDLHPRSASGQAGQAGQASSE